MISARRRADIEVDATGPSAPRHHSIQASLLALVAACLTPALLVSGYLVYQNHTQHRERLERDAVLQARNLAAALDREFCGVVSGLRVLSTSPLRGPPPRAIPTASERKTETIETMW